MRITYIAFLLVLTYILRCHRLQVEFLPFLYCLNNYCLNNFLSIFGSSSQQIRFKWTKIHGNKLSLSVYCEKQTGRYPAPRLIYLLHLIIIWEWMKKISNQLKNFWNLQTSTLLRHSNIDFSCSLRSFINFTILS